MHSESRNLYMLLYSVSVEISKELFKFVKSWYKELVMR